MFERFFEKNGMWIIQTLTYKDGEWYMSVSKCSVKYGIFRQTKAHKIHPDAAQRWLTLHSNKKNFKTWGAA